jgi:hypothetical protein
LDACFGGDACPARRVGPAQRPACPAAVAAGAFAEQIKKRKNIEERRQFDILGLSTPDASRIGHLPGRTRWKSHKIS